VATDLLVYREALATDQEVCRHTKQLIDHVARMRINHCLRFKHVRHDLNSSSLSIDC